MASIPNLLPLLQSYPQWVCYIFLARSGGKRTKPPINPHKDVRLPLKQRLADPTDPATWGTYEQALQALQRGSTRGYMGIGFVLTADDPFCVIDFDHLFAPDTKLVAAPWAKRAIQELATYTERSPSGDGAHVWSLANLALLQEHLDLPELHHKNRARGIEIYDRERYITWTGNAFSSTGLEIAERQQEIEAFYRTFLLEQATPARPPAVPIPRETPTKRGNTRTRVFLDDETILARARLGERGARFQRLFSGDTSDYPAGQDKDDYSAADLALCGIFAYWTGNDAAQMDRLFRRSQLYDRDQDRMDKWERVGDRTIQLAIANCYRTYDPAWAEAHRFQPSQGQQVLQTATRSNTPAPTMREKYRGGK